MVMSYRKTLLLFEGYNKQNFFFYRIYKYQAHEYAFSTIEGLLRSLGGDHFVNLTQRSVGESLQGIGVSQRFIDDVISAVIKASYGQSVSIPALVGKFKEKKIFLKRGKKGDAAAVSFSLYLL